MAGGIRDDFLQWDRGLIGTFVTLCWRPARVPRAYIYERDTGFTAPWRYLLFAVLVSVTATWLVIKNVDLPQQTPVASGNAHLGFLLDNAALLTLLTLPIFALAMRICFIGLRVRYVDALVVLFYTQGHIDLLSLGSLGVLALTKSEAAAAWLQPVLLIYFVWACAAFAKGPWWWRVLAAFATLVACQLVNAAVVYAALHLT